MLRRDRIYCDGGWRPSEGSGAIEVVDPATEEVVATVPEGRAADVDAAVDAAVRALPLWSAASPAERARHLRAVTDGLLARRAELSRTITTELGMPLAQSDAVQVGMALTTFASMAELAACPPPEERLGHSVVVREPVGVVGAITPWNYPLQQIAAKVAAALAAGCTVVLKPSEVAPLNAFLLADVVDRAGLPPGVFNLVCGVGPVVGEAIASHPAVDMVSFTGSTRAGRRVAALAAETVKRVALELGGKSPALLLDDADLESAVPAVVAAAYANSGQACSALTRLLVPADRLAEVEDLAVQAARSYQVGDPFAQETDLGPVVSAVQRDRVRGYIVRGVDEGARLLTGGPEPPAGLDRGYYVRPTVFSSVAPGSTIAQEEIFGPVLSILPYRSEDEAVAVANGTVYGLSAGVWSSDPDRALAVARRLRAGHVRLNGSPFDLLAPFGGVKQSGVGREQGPVGVEEFLERKTVTL